jgi:hypothetical protein
MRWTAGALTGAAVLVLAAGCDSTSGQPAAAPAPGDAGRRPAASPTRTPVNVNVGAALEVSAKEFQLLTAGDWAGAWALWTSSAQRQVPRDAFIAVNRACPAMLRQVYKLQDVQPIKLTYRRADNVHQGSLQAAGSGWRFEPDAKTLLEYGDGADAAIAKRKAARQCT